MGGTENDEKKRKEKKDKVDQPGLLPRVVSRWF
jgi:hypothetical protein